MLRLLSIVPLLPLAGFIVVGLLRRRLSERLVGLLACGTIAVAFLISVGAVSEYGTTRWSPEENKAYLSSEAGESFPHQFTWIPGGGALTRDGLQVKGGLTINWVYQLDSLSAVMLLIVTGVGLLIHIFAIGYMRGDPGFGRFFAYLNLFMFSMLVLVLGSNLAMVFVGWEGVGLCSYLLIGYYTNRVEAGDAAKKAFIANRIGDVGFLLGMFGLFALFGTIDFEGLRLAAATVPPEVFGTLGAVGLACLGLFVGATGKSAQIPLFVWLPDAMAGPTPVSALIHAATMVTAGVYLLARMAFLFYLSPTVMAIIAIIGAATALLGAAIAITQNDIKKVLAYSTISQLGFMVLACGVGAFAIAIFHVLTHAFFKALLFLGAGSVIHASHHEQDMRKLGGLRKAMPITHATMVAGWLAICGIFPLAGFFSKDEILWKTFSLHLLPQGLGTALWVVGALTAAMTAFYMTRLMAMTFWVPAKHESHAHESPRVMTLPLIVLAVLSVVGGWIGVGAIVPVLGSHEPPIVFWLSPALHAVRYIWLLTGPAFWPTGFVTPAEGQHGASPAEYVLAGLSLALALGGMWLAYRLYVQRPELPAKIAARIAGLYRASLNKFWVDEAYGVFPIGLTLRLASLAQFTDSAGVDRLVNETARATHLGAIASRLVDKYVVDVGVRVAGGVVYYSSFLFNAAQTGYFQNYALAFLLGLLAFLAYFQWDAVVRLFLAR